MTDQMVLYRDRGFWLEPATRDAPPAAQVAPSRTPPSPHAFGIGGEHVRARLSVDDTSSAIEGVLSASLRTALSDEDRWRGGELDGETLSRMSPDELIKLLCNLSPEFADALWQFMRFVNPGWTATASRPGGALKGKGAHQDALDAFMRQLADRHGATDVPINRLLISAYLRGGLLAELVLDENARMPLDLATPDPISLEWQKIADPVLGEVWTFGQRRGGKFVRLDEYETIRYAPIDPFITEPQGRSPSATALFSAIFLLAMLHDLRRVVQQQGYPRIDISIDMARMRQMMPADLESDPSAAAAWVKAAIAEIRRVYAALQPDDAYVHPDVTTVNRPVGTLDSSSLGAVDGLMKAVERMIVRGLKMAPILLAMTDGVSEANVRVQWRIMKQTFKALQHLVEQLLDRLLTLALRAQGIAAVVEFKFADVDIIDKMIDAQTDEITIRNARAMYEAGWISQDEAARRGANVEKADVPEPRGGVGAPAPEPQPMNATDVPNGSPTSEQQGANA